MGIKKDTIKSDAGLFLKTGKIINPDLDKLAADCSRLIRTTTEKSSSEAIRLGQAFVQKALPHRGVLLQSAYRASGWAFLIGGKFLQAEKAYLSARELLKRKPLMRAKVDRVLIDVYMYLGNFKESRRRARQAINTFEKLQTGDDLAQTNVNYANTLHRQDRHTEALELYREAGEYFSKKNNTVAAAFCYHNEANALVQLFEFKSAEALYTKAESIFLKEKYALRANGCRYGLAWLHMLEGNYHIALKELLDCENHYSNADQPREVVLCQLDRAEVYIGLNLYSDARRIAATAEKSAQKLGVLYESAKGALFYAKASVALGKTSDALKALKRAQQGFSLEKNDAFLGTVELTRIPIENDPNLRVHKIKEARRRFSKAQLPLWEAICDLQILSDWPDDKDILERLSRNPAINTVPHLLARWHTMEGDRTARQGKLDDAIKNWQKACKVLDSVRAKLPPVDLRTSFLKNQGDPYCRLIQAELKRDPIAAAAWSEMFKTAGLWQIDTQALIQNPFRSKAEKSLSKLATHITAYSSVLEKSGNRRSLTSVCKSKSCSDLQEQVRASFANLDILTKSSEHGIEQAIDQISQVSSEIPVVQFHAGPNNLVAFVHHKGESHAHQYQNGSSIAKELMGQWRFIVERAPFVTGRELKSNLRDEKQVLSRIGDWLFSPLEIPKNCQRLLILPEGKVANLPWQAIIHDKQHLANNYEIVLSPSLRHYLNAKSRQTHSKRIELFIGDIEGLDHIKEEISVLLNKDSANVSIHDPGLRRDWPNDSSAKLWHFVGHANFRSENPFYSSLIMNDGAFFAADFRLKQNTVNLVTLAGCRTGQQSSVAGEESVGLNRSLLEMGARNVLVSQWAVHNEATVEWMSEFYARFLKGESIPSAVRQTSVYMQNKYASAYQWGSFILYGAG